MRRETWRHRHETGGVIGRNAGPGKLDRLAVCELAPNRGAQAEYNRRRGKQRFEQPPVPILIFTPHGTVDCANSRTLAYQLVL